jgi:hypothetical protein
MAVYQRLTERVLASGVTTDDLIHIVITGDTSQDPDGSSYKAKISQVFDSISGYCFTDFYVSNIHSCSPLNINPLDEGDVYFGSTSGITLDILNKRIGINTSTPQYVFDARGIQSRLYYDSESVGGRLLLSGNTNVPRISVAITPYLTKPIAGFELGMRAWNDVSYPGYGKVGDAFFYAGNETYGFNFLNPSGTGTEDYIRFYAGQTANGTTPDIHIQGSGATRGYVGIGTTTPTQKLHVSGNTKIDGGLTANTISATTYQNLPTDIRVTGATYSNNTFTYTNNTGGTFSTLFNTVTGLTVNGGLTANTISATTYLNLPVNVFVTSAITSSQTLTWDKSYWGVSGSSNVDITLPSTTSRDGYFLIIKDEAGTSGSFRIRLTPTSGLIDGNSYVDMNINYMSLTIMVRNGNWYLI